MIHCFFDIKDKIHQHRDRYLKKYDAIPSFNAALHCGEVAKGEIGFIKSEIVYHGDVLNSTSRILEACNHVDNELLVSSQLLNQIALPGFLQANKCGNMKLKGKRYPMELYSIQRLNDKPVTA
jgi:adenylate cyclase